MTHRHCSAQQSAAAAHAERDAVTQQAAILRARETLERASAVEKVPCGQRQPDRRRARSYDAISVDWMEALSMELLRQDGN